MKHQGMEIFTSIAFAMPMVDSIFIQFRSETRLSLENYMCAHYSIILFQHCLLDSTAKGFIQLTEVDLLISKIDASCC